MNTRFLSYFAGLSVLSMLIGILSNALVLGLFGIAVSALLLLIAVTDYAPRRSYRDESCVALCRTERLPFAA
jgi:hypothetical protein